MADRAPEVGIVGMGLQGTSLAQRFARAGLQVLAYDSSPDRLTLACAGLRPPAARALVRACHDLADLAACTLILEAVPEDLALKRGLLSALEAHAPLAVLCSNSSSFTPEELGVSLRRPERYLNLHFLGPETGSPLLELVRGPATSEAAARCALELVRAAGFDPVAVGSCTAFVYNRIGNAGVGNLGRAVDLGLLDLPTFCRYHVAMRPRPRPAAVLDFLGLDVILAVLRACQRTYGSRFGVPRWLEELVAAGRLGVKSGAGLTEHRPRPRVPDERVLPPSSRPTSPYRTVGLRGPSLLVSPWISALLGRPDRRLVFFRGEAEAFLDGAGARAPHFARELEGRYRVAERPAASEVDVLVDCAWHEAPADKARALTALAAGGGRTPVLVCAPHGSLAELRGAVRAEAGLGLMFTIRGQALDTEWVRGAADPRDEPLRQLVLEATGRVLEISDGPVRPLALLAVGRHLEALRVVREGIATRAQVGKLWGDELLRDADEWSPAALRTVVAAADTLLGTSLQDAPE